MLDREAAAAEILRAAYAAHEDARMAVIVTAIRLAEAQAELAKVAS